jgi:hypothetical protein
VDPKCAEGTCYHSKGITKIAHGRYEVDGCPEKLLTPEVVEQVQVWSRWKMFGAPVDGPWSDWPARLVDLLEGLEREHQELQRIEAEWARENRDGG